MVLTLDLPASQRSNRRLLRFAFATLVLPLPTLASAAAKPSEKPPSYEFSYPRAIAYSGDVNEPLLSNGSLTAFLMNQGDSSFYPNQLKKILAPPFLLNNDQGPTLVVWGYDDEGYHAAENPTFQLQYGLDGMQTQLNEISYVADGVPRTNKHWQVTVAYHAVAGQRTLLATYTYKNLDTRPHPLRIAAGLQRPQIRRTLDWAWDNPQGGSVNAVFVPTLGAGAITTSSTSADAFLVFGLDVKADWHAVTTGNEYTNWAATGQLSGASSVSEVASHQQVLAHDCGTLAPGQSTQVNIILSLAGTEAEASAAFLAAAAAPAAAVAKTSAYWQDQWAASHVLVATPDPDLDRMSQLSLYTGLMSWDTLNNSWITGFANNARGIVYRWDTYYAGKGFLLTNPELAKATLRRHLASDWRQHYAYRLVDGLSVGDYYSYNHMAITNMVYQYVALTGDRAFLQEKLLPIDTASTDSGKTVLQILIDECTYIDAVLHYDFGENHNLLEVVPRYVHAIPDLTADTYDMANKIAALAQISDQPAAAAEMARIAATALKKTQALWNPQLRWFQTGDGAAVYTTQVLDMIPTGAISDEQVNGLLARSQDFIFAHGTRSLAVYDDNYNRDTRGDWDGPGAYIGVPANVMDDLAYARRGDQLYALAKGIAQWWQWRPVTAQGIEATTGAIVGSIGLSTLSTAARYVEVVPYQLIGLRDKLGGLDVYPNIPASWSNAIGPAALGGQRYAAMVRVPYRGQIYNIYIDKPATGEAQYVGATAVSAAKDVASSPAMPVTATLWPAQRLPMATGPEINLVLHFAASSLPNPEPAVMVSDFDELSEVTSVTSKGISLKNPYSPVEFSVAAKAVLPHWQVQLLGKPNQNYAFSVDGDTVATVQAEATGALTFNYQQVPGAALHRLRLTPTGSAR